MSESQGYKLGMKMGLSDKGALFAKIRRDGSKREVELLMGSGSASTAFRRGLKQAAFELKQGKRRPAARQKTTRQRLTTAMSEQKFWPIVRSLQWRTARSGVPDMEKRREKFQSLVSAGQRKPFDARLKQLRQKLDESIQAWEAKTGKQIPLGGDGYRDLLNHIIGLGKTEYSQTLRSPKRAFDRAKSRDFFESFVYITFAPSRKRKNPRERDAMGRFV